MPAGRPRSRSKLTFVLIMGNVKAKVDEEVGTVSRGQLREDKVRAEAAVGKRDGKCGTCVKLVQDGVQCEICDQWFHSHYQGISVSLYAGGL